MVYPVPFRAFRASLTNPACLLMAFLSAFGLATFIRRRLAGPPMPVLAQNSPSVPRVGGASLPIPGIGIGIGRPPRGGRPRRCLI